LEKLVQTPGVNDGTEAITFLISGLDTKTQIPLAYLNAICDWPCWPVDKNGMMAFNRLIFQQQEILSAIARHGKHQVLGFF